MPTLSIDVEARFAKFQDSLDGIQRDVGRAVGNLEKTFSRLGGAFGTLIAGAGAGGIAAAFKATVDQLDAFNDASDQTGASVEQLSSLLNTLSPYGAGLEDITNVAGLLTKAMRGAEEETSKAAGAFKALGVDTRDAAGNFRPIQDVLEDVAKALDKYADGTNKTALAQDILGKGAAQYMPMLKDLAQAQRASATVTTEQAEAAEKFKIELGKVTRELDNLRVQLAGPVLDKLNELIEQFKLGKEAAGGFWSALGRYGLMFGPDKSPADRIDEISKKLADARQRLAAAEQQADQGATFGGGARTAAGKRANALRDEIKQYERDIKYFGMLVAMEQRRDPSLRGSEDRGFTPSRGNAPRNPDRDKKKDKDSLREVEDYAMKVRSAVADAINTSDIANARLYADALDELDRLFFQAGLSAEVYDSAVSKLSKLKSTTGKDGVAELNRELDRQTEAFLGLIDPLREYRKQLEQIDALERAFADSGGERGLSPFQAQVARGTLQAKFDPAEITDDVEKVDDAARQLGLTFESAAENAIVKFEKLSEVFKGLGQDILRIFVRKGITEPLGNFVTDLFKNAGPELLNVFGGVATKSLSAGAIGGASGGITINQNNTFSGGRSDADMARLAKSIQRETVVGLQEAKLRGATA